MRHFVFLTVLLALPVSAVAQHSPTLPSIAPPLPSIGLPLPAIGLGAEPWKQRIPWENPRPPAWERQQLPPWERGYVAPPVQANSHRRRYNDPRVIFIPYPVAVQQDPQVIVVQQPPVTRIVHVEVPAPERAEEPPRPAEPPAPPYVPTGDRTVYVIPGCYVGNVSPVNLKLAARCDITKLTTYVP